MYRGRKSEIALLSPFPLLSLFLSLFNGAVKVKGKVHPRTGHEDPEGE